MADQKISELQLVVATGVAATGIYVPLYTPMLAPANRRISAAEFFKTPKRIEVSDPTLAGAGEVMTLTTSYGTASLRVGTGGQFIVGGDLAAVGEIAVKSDSFGLKLGISSDVGFLRSASGVARVINSSGGYATLESSNISVTPAWSGTGTATTPLLVNVTADPGPANAASKLLDLQVGGSSRVSVLKGGLIGSHGSHQSLPPADSVPRFGNWYGWGAFYFGNALLATFNAGGLNLSNATILSWNSDVVLTNDAADTLAQRRTANAQKFSVYKTFTTSSDYERGVLDWQGTSGTLRIGTEHAGTGTARAVSIVTGGTERLGFNSAGTIATFSSRLAVPAGDVNGGAIVFGGTSQQIYQGATQGGNALIFSSTSQPMLAIGQNTGIGIVVMAPMIFTSAIGSTADAGIVRSATGILSITNASTGPGTLAIDNVQGTNYERLRLDWSANVARMGTERGGSGIARNFDLQASGITRVSIPAASGSAVTITSYDLVQGNVLALTSPSGTAAIRVGAGGQLVNVGNFASVGEIAVVSDSQALKLGLNSDVGLVRSASGVARVVDVSTSNYGSLEAKRFISTFGAAAGSSLPMVSGSQTWNDGAVTFVGVGFNITDNGSNALSRALDIQVNGTGVLSVQKNGTVTTNYYITNAAASAGLYARSNTGLVSFGVSDDVVITRDAADVAAQRRATNAQNFRIYNSYISAGVNEYLNLGFSSANVAQIGTLRSGSGIVRSLDIMSSGIPRITVPASHNTAVSVSGSLNVSGTFTGVNSPGLAIAQTWNNATTDFTALTVDIIPQNAGSSSNFIEFKSSGTSYAKLTQFGDFQSSSFTPADLGTRMGSSGIKMGTAAQYTFVNSTSAASSAIAAGLTLGGSGVVKVTNGFADTGSITVRNVNSTVFTITDATGVDINPASGAIQVWTLGATRTPSANNFAAGQSVTLMVDDGSGFSINWGTMGVSWLNSTPPALPTSGYGVIELWKVGSTIYGTSVGNVV